MLNVQDAGNLTISVSGDGNSVDPFVVVIRPDGQRLSNDDGYGYPTGALILKNAKAGTYTVQAIGNELSPEPTGYHTEASLSSFSPFSPTLIDGGGEGGAGDATVVAVIDSSFNPYHWDFHATRMPQATNASPDDDMPLHLSPTQWLPGFPKKEQLASLEPLRITLEPEDRRVKLEALRQADADVWASVESSTAATQHLYWIPDTKVIAAATFSPGGKIIAGPNSHGLGTSSSAAGNLHGTCPECLLVILQYSDYAGGEAAINWAMRQPWIDVVSNSYGFGITHEVSQQSTRDNIYSGADVDLQRRASERGQTIVFSAGNGVENGYSVPNSTEFSSQKGPDWIVTVGAVSPPEDGYYQFGPSSGEPGGYLGAGKPVDIASVGAKYPNAYRADGVADTSIEGFSGTSNAAPVISGLYARSLYFARSWLVGVSRVQEKGLVGRGAPFGCGPARPRCELGDGRLTATELRKRLLHGAVPTGNGLTVHGQQLLDVHLPPVGEESLLAEGHGTYFGRARRHDAGWTDEQFRITDPLRGVTDAVGRPEGERDWMTVDSYCRQRQWGRWSDGYYVDGSTMLPADDPQWPVRTTRAHSCLGGALP